MRRRREEGRFVIGAARDATLVANRIAAPVVGRPKAVTHGMDASPRGAGDDGSGDARRSPRVWLSLSSSLSLAVAESTLGDTSASGRRPDLVARESTTTLFNAAMRFGLEIGERDNYYYYIDRYPTGLDATVAIVDDSVKDMPFGNDTQHPIVIRGFGTPGQVTLQLWSVPNGRSVALSDPAISNQRGAIETTQVSSDLAPGTSRRVEYPHDGFDVSVNRTVTGADGTVLRNNTWFSNYRPVNGITLVGPTAAAPSDDTAAGDEGELLQ